MANGRNFEFPFDVVQAVHKEVWRHLEAVERGEIPHLPTKQILDILRPFVRDSLAAEYDRGYKTALELERPEFNAWERGHEDTKKYYHHLFQYRADGGHMVSKPVKPVNPYGDAQ